MNGLQCSHILMLCNLVETWGPMDLEEVRPHLSVSALLHQLYLEPLEERRRISRLTFLYKVLHEHVRVSPDHLDLILADRLVRGTVTKQTLKILRCSTTQFQKSFVPRTITQWNTLPDSITSAASVSAFRSQLSSVTRP